MKKIYALLSVIFAIQPIFAMSNEQKQQLKMVISLEIQDPKRQQAIIDALGINPLTKLTHTATDLTRTFTALGATGLRLPNGVTAEINVRPTSHRERCAQDCIRAMPVCLLAFMFLVMFGVSVALLQLNTIVECNRNSTAT